MNHSKFLGYLHCAVEHWDLHSSAGMGRAGEGRIPSRVQRSALTQRQITFISRSTKVPVNDIGVIQIAIAKYDLLTSSQTRALCILPTYFPAAGASKVTRPRQHRTIAFSTEAGHHSRARQSKVCENASSVNSCALGVFLFFSSCLHLIPHPMTAN